MRVHVVDPSAYTPPYDHALCRALGAAGVDVELFTSRFAYGAVPPADGYVRHELFYRLAHRGAAGGRRSRARLALKLAEHVPDMLRYRRAAAAADVVHFQWLTVQPLDVHLLPRRRASAAGARPKLVLTAHDVLPREPRPGQLAAQRRLYERMDAVVVHSEHGRRRLTEELGLDPAQVHTIPHGVLRPWEGSPSAAEGSAAEAAERSSTAAPMTRLPDGELERLLPAELRGAAGPVVLFFGLLRPYKGLDVLLEAWRGPGGEAPGVAGAELWIVGMPRMDLTALDAAHGGVLDRSPIEDRPAQHTSLPGSCPSGTRHQGRQQAHGSIRFVSRFVSDAEVHALMRRASLVVPPYREIDQSGVLFTALGAGRPLLLSDVGGFPEIAATGAARTVAAGDPAALRGALLELLGDPAALAEMTACARAAAAGRYSWEAVAAAHVRLYERLLAD